MRTRCLLLTRENKFLCVRLPPTSLSPEARYEKFALAFGGRGYFVETPSELLLALEKVLSTSTNKPSIINVMIDTTAQRKGQVQLRGKVEANIVNLNDSNNRSIFG